MERRKGTPAHPPIPASSQSPRAVPAGKPRPQEAWLGSGQGVHSLLEVDILILPVPGVGEVAGVGLCPAGEQRVLGDVDSDVLRRGDDEGRPWGTGTNVTSPGAGGTTAPAAGALPPRKGRPSPRSDWASTGPEAGSTTGQLSWRWIQLLPVLRFLLTLQVPRMHGVQKCGRTQPVADTHPCTAPLPTWPPE